MQADRDGRLGLSAQYPARAPLRRWHRPEAKSSWTTAASPTKLIEDGWLLDEVVGGVLRAAINVHVRWSRFTNYTYSLAVETRVGGWITCIDANLIGAAPSVTFDGTCPSAGNAVINHSDVIAFRVTYTKGTSIYIAEQPYDGFSSDVYVGPLTGTPNPPPTALTALKVTWSSVSDRSVYTVSLESGGKLTVCAGPDAVANDTSYLHLGTCPLDGTDIKISTITLIQVCAVDRDTHDKQGCAKAKWDRKSPSIQLKL